MSSNEIPTVKQDVGARGDTSPEEQGGELNIFNPGYNNPSASNLCSNPMTPVQIGIWLNDISTNSQFIEWLMSNDTNRTISGSDRPINEINIILKELYLLYIESRITSQTTS